MSELDDMPFAPPDPGPDPVPFPPRARPGRVSSTPPDPARQRRNRNNRARGGAAELEVARALGGRKVGVLGLPWDVELAGYMRLQVKKLATWPSLSRVAGWLDGIPPGQEMRGVAIVEAVGPRRDRRPRRLLVLDLEEFARWHGREVEP